MYSTITDADRTFKQAYKEERITPAQIRQLADDFSELMGLECTIHPKALIGLREALKYLHQKHPTLQKVTIRIEVFFQGLLRQLSDDCPILTGLTCVCEKKDEELDDEVDILVKKHPELQTLELNFGRISGKGLSSLLQLNHLQVLDLEELYMMGENLEAEKTGEGTLSGLKVLKLTKCRRLTQAGLNNLLTRGEGLKELNFSGTLYQLSSEGITATLPQLQTLNLSLCANVTDSDLDHMLLKWGGRLRALDLSGTNISGEGITATLPWLEKLNLTGSKNITDLGLDNMLLKVGGRLEELNLRGTNISGEEISATLPHLKKLSLSWCRNISESVVDKMLLKWGAGLKILTLCGTKVSGEGISATLPQLQELNLYRCDEITDPGLDKMLNLWGAHLWELNLIGNLKLTNLYTARISTRFPHLCIR